MMAMQTGNPSASTGKWLPRFFLPSAICPFWPQILLLVHPFNLDPHSAGLPLLLTTIYNSRLLSSSRNPFPVVTRLALLLPPDALQGRVPTPNLTVILPFSDSAHVAAMILHTPNPLVSHR
jgi:hypothetical protein